MKITKRELKFDLVLEGEKIKSLDELREHPSTELLDLQKDGRLSRWLRAHGGTNEADKICEMSLSGNTARDLYAICQVLAVDIELEDIIDALKDERLKDSVPTSDSVEENCKNMQEDPVKNLDAEDFLKWARMIYTRLQASWDRRDMDDIAQFVTAPVMEELYRQQAEDPNPGRTQILMLNAKLVNEEEFDGQDRAQVYFDALLIEDPQQTQPANARELWTFVRDHASGNWKLDGIQQTDEDIFSSQKDFFLLFFGDT